MGADSIVLSGNSCEEAPLFGVERSISRLGDSSDVVSSRGPIAWMGQLLGDLPVVERPDGTKSSTNESVIPIVAVDKQDRSLIHGEKKPRRVARSQTPGGLVVPSLERAPRKGNAGMLPCQVHRRRASIKQRVGRLTMNPPHSANSRTASTYSARDSVGASCCDFSRSTRAFAYSRSSTSMVPWARIASAALPGMRAACS